MVLRNMRYSKFEISRRCQRWVMLEDLKSCRGVAREIRLEKKKNNTSWRHYIIFLSNKTIIKNVSTKQIVYFKSVRSSAKEIKGWLALWKSKGSPSVCFFFPSGLWPGCSPVSVRELGQFSQGQCTSTSMSGALGPQINSTSGRVEQIHHNMVDAALATQQRTTFKLRRMPGSCWALDTHSRTR